MSFFFKILNYVCSLNNRNLLLIFIKILCNVKSLELLLLLEYPSSNLVSGITIIEQFILKIFKKVIKCIVNLPYLKLNYLFCLDLCTIRSTNILISGIQNTSQGNKIEHWYIFNSLSTLWCSPFEILIITKTHPFSWWQPRWPL